MPKIYTKTGDRGETGLLGGHRVSKNHPRVRAYGAVDELNSVLGLAAACSAARKNLSSLHGSLARIQEELFMIGSILAAPSQEIKLLVPPFDHGVPPEAIERLEWEIDAMTVELKPLKRFILPGGASEAAWFHLARSVCRRAERETIALRENTPVPEGVIVYLNRLSDFLFVAARWVSRRLKRKEIEWAGLAASASRVSRKTK